MTRRLLAATFAAALLSAPPTGLAQAADPLAGAKIAAEGNAAGAPPCGSCHGEKGEGQPETGFPRLAGQNAAYLVRQLDGFAGGTRPNDIMKPIAEALTPVERADVAAYFQGLQAVSPPGPQMTPEAAKRGFDLAAYGDWPKGQPACSQCHGLKGEGVGAAFPMISGQGAAYIETQLRAWRSGERRDDPMALMRGVAERLSDDDILAVAGFYADAQAWAGQPTPSKPAPGAAPSKPVQVKKPVKGNAK